MFAPFLFNHAVHKLVIFNAHTPVKYIRVKFFPVPVGLFGKGKPGGMSSSPRLINNLRGKPVVVRPDKTVNIVPAVFIVIAHSGGQLVKAHVLAQLPAVVAVQDNGGGVSRFDFL